MINIFDLPVTVTVHTVHLFNMMMTKYNDNKQIAENIPSKKITCNNGRCTLQATWGLLHHCCPPHQRMIPL
jgi:hypothetical protein